MRSSRSSVALLVWLIFLGLITEPATALRAQVAPLAGFDAYVERAMHDWRVPGVAVAVVKDDSVVFARGYGVRKRGEPGRVDEHTVFGVGSVTKAFTAAVAGSLVAEGRMGWDDPVTKHLPWLQFRDPWMTRQVTIRDLLSHRSGLSSGNQLWYAFGYGRDEILRRIRHLPPGPAFRSDFDYNNLGLLAAGQAAAAAGGRSWDDLVRERIFRPLGMSSTTTSVDSLAGMKNVAMPHIRAGDKVESTRYARLDHIGPAGAVNSNALDLARWVRMQLGEGRLGEVQVLPAEVVREMHTPQIAIRNPAWAAVLPDARIPTYGLGWFVRDYRGRKAVEHGGLYRGIKAHVAIIPEEQLGVVVLSNLGESDLPQALALRALDAFLGGEPRDWSAELLARSSRFQETATEAERRIQSKRPQASRPTLPLPAHAGTYRDSLNGDVRVSYGEGRLVLHLGSEFAGDLEHWHGNRFRIDWRDPYFQARPFVTFVADASGRALEMELDGFGTFRRVPDPPSAGARRCPRSSVRTRMESRKPCH
jgi:CubicO group peptidase (beta-lactamase class C family)